MSKFLNSLFKNFANFSKDFEFKRILLGLTSMISIDEESQPLSIEEELTSLLDALGESTI